jgi:hypothetical protein
MGWTSAGGDDLIGDTPADAVMFMFEERQKRGDEKPALSELLGAIRAVLNEKAAEYLEDGAALDIKDVTIRGATRAATPEGEESAGNSLVSDVDETIRKFVIEYDQLLDRKPRLNEVLATFAFVLDGEPEKYVEDAGVAPIKVGDIVAEK